MVDFAKPGKDIKIHIHGLARGMALTFDSSYPENGEEGAKKEAFTFSDNARQSRLNGFAPSERDAIAECAGELFTAALAARNAHENITKTLARILHATEKTGADSAQRA